MRLNKFKSRAVGDSGREHHRICPLGRRVPCVGLGAALARARSTQQLAGHIPTGRASDVVMTGADIMGAIVLLMAVIAILFLVTTFIRRRGTVHVTSVPATSS